MPVAEVSDGDLVAWVPEAGDAVAWVPEGLPVGELGAG